MWRACLLKLSMNAVIVKGRGFIYVSQSKQTLTQMAHVTLLNLFDLNLQQSLCKHRG